MRSLFKVFFVGIFLIVSCRAAGNTNGLFRHLTTKDGLSNSYVKTFLKDSYGFLWVGTESGLNRYDGYGFKTYTVAPGESDGLPTNDIHSLQEDGLGNIWIKWGYGILVYNREKDSFNSDPAIFLESMGIEVDSVVNIHVDQNKDLWVLSVEKIVYYNTRIQEPRVFNDKLSLSRLAGSSLSDDGEGLLGIQANGDLWKLDKFSGHLSKIEIPPSIVNEISNIGRGIFVDQSKGIWLYAYKTDLIYYKRSPRHDWAKVKLSSTVNSQTNIVQSILDDAKGNVWIGTDHKGIFVYNKDTEVVSNFWHDPWEHTSLSSNNVSCLYRDSNDIVWIGHYKKGISYYHESFQTIINFHHPECREINVILEDQKGDIWLGTDGNGLFIRDKSNNGALQKLPFPNYAIVTLLEDRKGRIWIGTFQNGLFCYEGGEISQFTQGNSRLINDNIWSLQEDRNGKIWIGTLIGGIQSLDPDTKIFYPIDPNQEGFHSLGMFYDNEHKLYVGNVFGLATIDFNSGQSLMHYGNSKGTQAFKQMLISCVYKDSQDVLWLGHFNGLTLWDLKKDSIYTIDKSKGLADDIIRGIVEDNNQNVWITTSNGFSIIRVIRDDNGALTYTCQNFSTKDGLIDNYFNSNSLTKLSNGDILMGGPDGYSHILPDKMVEKNAPLARVMFTGLEIGNRTVQIDSLYNGQKILDRPLEATTSLAFSYKNKLISFQITAGDFLNTDKVTYLYQLEGLNSQWISTQENRIVFTSISPGDYRLKVKASNRDGVWNEDYTAIDIVVLPPVYLTKWAIALYMILGVFAMLVTIRRIIKVHSKKLELQRLGMEQEQRNRLNEMKIKFFTNISHDLRTPLTLIITPLQSLIEEVTDRSFNKRLRMINKNAEQLLQLMNSLLDVRKLDEGAETLFLISDDLVAFVRDVCHPFHLYAAERHIHFSFSTEEKSMPMSFDHDKIKKILNNLLSNAFKYTPRDGSIAVHLFSELEKVHIQVSDTGPGISREDKIHIFERFYQSDHSPDKTGSGIGLHIVSEYVRLHRGEIELIDNQPNGCVFVIKLPHDEAANDYCNSGKDKELELNESEFKQKENHVTTILIVDDNKDFCDFMSDSLSSEYAVLIGYNGQEALDLLNKHDVDIVVSDVMMPIMSGTELCKQIKTNLNWSHIPVILLTAKTADQHKMEGYEIGADDYITKPFNFELLKIRIRKLIERTKNQHLDFSRKMDVSPSEITITSLDEKFISEAIKIVEAFIGDPDFSVEELGARLGVSRSQLYKKLMSITGKGPVEFIRILRIKRGMQLLGKSQMQIAEIAYSVGFNSPKRFSKYFRNEFGLSPSDYLQRQSEEHNKP